MRKYFLLFLLLSLSDAAFAALIVSPITAIVHDAEIAIAVIIGSLLALSVAVLTSTTVLNFVNKAAGIFREKPKGRYRGWSIDEGEYRYEKDDFGNRWKD